jgi:signal transduction histidine kinase
VRVTADIDPSATAVPTATGLTAYRVVQEGLTNVVKHAPGACAHVEIRVDGDDLTVTVTDEPVPGATRLGAGTPGVGLIGLQERVELLGGTLDASRVDGGGFRLTAHLPLGVR